MLIKALFCAVSHFEQKCGTSRTCTSKQALSKASLRLIGTHSRALDKARVPVRRQLCNVSTLKRIKTKSFCHRHNFPWPQQDETRACTPCTALLLPSSTSGSGVQGSPMTATASHGTHYHSHQIFLWEAGMRQTSRDIPPFPEEIYSTSTTDKLLTLRKLKDSRPRRSTFTYAACFPGLEKVCHSARTEVCHSARRAVRVF